MTTGATEMIYPWTLVAEGPIAQIGTWLDPATPTPARDALTTEQTDQCNIAKAQAKAFLTSYKTTYTYVTVSLSGLANPGHAPVEGMPDERVDINMAFSSPTAG